MRQHHTRTLTFILVIYIVGQIGVILYSTQTSLTSITYVAIDKQQVTQNIIIEAPVVKRVFEKVDPFYILREAHKNLTDRNVAWREAFKNVTGGNVVSWKKINYEQFSIREPYFIDNTSRKLFFMNKKNPDVIGARPEDTLHGEIVLVKHGTIDITSDCGYKSKIDWLRKNRTVPRDRWFQTLVPLVVPDGHTFQHFLDGTLPKIVQALPLLQNQSVKILIPSIRDSIIWEIFEQLNISKSQLVFKSGTIYGADLIIYPCITPPIHPVLWKEARRQLGAPSHLEIPPEEAYIVLVTRGGCLNCGRLILNKESLIKMLTDRYGPNVVKIFNGPISLKECTELFGRTRIIMGSHGGGMYNINFAPSKTAVIEFMPTHEDGRMGAASDTMIWHMSQMLDQDYWRLCIKPENNNNNMVVNLDLLGQLLDHVDANTKN